MDEPDGLTEWAADVPIAMREDPLWRLPAYRYSLYLGDLVQAELPRIRLSPSTRALADQLHSSVQSISANIAEGYSRTTGPERAKFFKYALGSTREARDWVYKIRGALDGPTAIFWIELLTRIMKILTVAINAERRSPETSARRPR